MDEKSINWEKSIKLNPGFTVDALKARFERFPDSHKRVIAICKGVNCDNRERDIAFRDYRDLCKSCAFELSYHDDPTRSQRQSKSLRETHQNDPTLSLRKQKAMNKRFAKMDDPGLEVCNHHVAYDFNNPETLTVQVTRRFHSQIHNPKGIPVTERGYSLID